MWIGLGLMLFVRTFLGYCNVSCLCVFRPSSMRLLLFRPTRTEFNDIPIDAMRRFFVFPSSSMVLHFYYFVCLRCDVSESMFRRAQNRPMIYAICIFVPGHQQYCKVLANANCELYDLRVRMRGIRSCALKLAECMCNYSDVEKYASSSQNTEHFHTYDNVMILHGNCWLKSGRSDYTQKNTTPFRTAFANDSQFNRTEHRRRKLFNNRWHSFAVENPIIQPG